jgi:hypothetical protein
MTVRQMEDALVNSGGEVVGRKFAEVSRSRCIAIGGREWQVGVDVRESCENMYMNIRSRMRVILAFAAKL